MPDDLKGKAKSRTIGEGSNAKSKSKKPSFTIEKYTSAGPFVKEQTIKLDPKVKDRGKGTIGVVMGKDRKSGITGGDGVTKGMGGRSSRR
jgi:hypothetical protein